MKTYLLPYPLTFVLGIACLQMMEEYLLNIPSPAPPLHTLPSHVPRTYFHKARRWQKDGFSILNNYSSTGVGWEDESSEKYIHTQAQLFFSPLPPPCTLHSPVEFAPLFTRFF